MRRAWEMTPEELADTIERYFHYARPQNRERFIELVIPIIERWKDKNEQD